MNPNPYNSSSISGIEQSRGVAMNNCSAGFSNYREMSNISTNSCSLTACSNISGSTSCTLASTGELNLANFSQEASTERTCTTCTGSSTCSTCCSYADEADLSIMLGGGGAESHVEPSISSSDSTLCGVASINRALLNSSTLVANNRPDMTQR